MNDYYICNLLQVTEHQGYIGNDNGQRSLTNEMAQVIYGGDVLHSKCNLEEIIVKRTANPWIVKEIITGKSIPLLYSTVKNDPATMYDTCYWTRYPLGKVHTFVRALKNESRYGVRKSCFYKVTDPKIVADYIHKHGDINAWDRTLDIYFQKGEAKMINKYNARENEKKDIAERKAKIKELVRRIPK